MDAEGGSHDIFSHSIPAFVRRNCKKKKEKKKHKKT
jgi:hypothetical protein